MYREGVESFVVPHQLIMEDRTTVELTGVTSVDNFDDNVVMCCTTKGKLTIRGNNLHLNKLDLEGTQVSIEGQIDSLEYADIRKGGVFGRLFR